jgi:hypothetical protein
MIDITELKDGWGEPEPPSPAARSAARAALMREITATRASEPAPRRPGRRLGRLVGGTVVTAAAAALVVALGPAEPGGPGEQATRSTPPLDGLSGRQVLLRAARVAHARPAGTGAYWHVDQEIPVPSSRRPVQRYNDWTSRDGVRYSMPDGHPGVSRIVAETGFPVGGSLLTLERVEGLPTDPDELTTWITDSYLPGNGPEHLAGLVPEALSRLLWEVPAPPAVRSAALRALATTPNVTNAGVVDGGRALRVFFAPPAADKFPDGKLPPGAGEMTLVIDPDTATLVSHTTYQGTTRILGTGWTDDLPEIIPFS